MSDDLNGGLLHLQAELEQERELREMLRESVSGLRSTMCELQERLYSVDEEGNEWKTRYETQLELNGQLGRQMSLIQERLEDLRGGPVDRLSSIRSFDDMSIEVLRQRLELLTEEKSGLQNQLMDYQLRMEQEAKAFHRTNDERRAYLSELAKVSSTPEGQRGQFSTRPQVAPASRTRREKRSKKAQVDPKKGEKRDDDGVRRGTTMA
ncbi:coiled-coil domain containing 169 isoform X1 [Takifugu flavidus]|uniref:Coiled-coil domain-containing protein 169 n=2 Tax=Takifugu flavidus TaxID=433684 RepID=A0A5C6P4D9_9TELE|nr:coiled-coil domain containing 169 isoform X1 [Takifugu flavidus]TWW74612.1 Coiled-coil domain-containing protein 169 [Takifugu flavidus]